MKNTHIYNFNLPDELRDYLKKITKEKHTKMSQYIIDLIVKDKMANEK